MAQTTTDPPGTQRPRLSIIVVSYNTEEMTLECLRSVYRETRDTPFELIVVDNDSPDRSAEAIAREFDGAPGFTLIASADNLGFAAANNLAAERARGEHLLLLNPDTVVLDRALDKLVAFADANRDARVWGGRTVFADGSLNPGSCWRRQTVLGMTLEALALNALFPKAKFLHRESYGGWDRSTVRRVDIVAGCLFLIEHELWTELGGFHPDFFMYGEEADLCLRAKKLGARPMVTPDATIVHYAGASERVRGERVAKLFLAKAKLLRRHWPPGLVWYGLGALHVRAWVRARLYGLAATLSKSEKHREQAEAWRMVWSLRSQWADPSVHTIAPSAPVTAPSEPAVSA